MAETSTAQGRRLSIITAIFFVGGIWLAASPYILGFSVHPDAWWNALLVGLCMVILAIIRAASPERFAGLRWTALVLGAWLVASPFIADYHYVGPAMWNAIIVGAVIILSATSSAAFPARQQA